MSTLKYSRQRECIKENLLMRTDHPTAEMIYTDIRKIYPHISLGTVYRNLTLLSELGEIQKITTRDGAVRFDGDTSNHIHFICRNCGGIQDLTSRQDFDFQSVLPRNFSGIVESAALTFFGLCEECSKNS